MKRTWLVMAAIAAILSSAEARAAVWELDPAHTGIHFKVRHLMVSHVRGDFERFSGTVRFDEQDITRSGADIAIEAASINTRVAKRDDHLRSPDFLDAARHPTLTFRSKKVEKMADGKLKMTGDLTIRGVTREAALMIEGPTPPIKDMQGKTRVGGSATAKINRTDYGLVWNKPLEAGGVVVGDDVEITIDVEIVKN